MKKIAKIVVCILILAPIPSLALSITAPSTGSQVRSDQYNTVVFSDVPFNSAYLIEIFAEKSDGTDRKILGNVPIADTSTYSYSWMPNNYSMSTGSYRIIVQIVDSSQKGGVVIAQGSSGVFSISGISSNINYVQSPAGYSNTLNPGERAKVYGTNIDNAVSASIANNSGIQKSSPLTNRFSGSADFVIPSLPSGSYSLALLDNAGNKISNTINVTILAKATVSPTAVPAAAPAQNSSAELREEEDNSNIDTCLKLSTNMRYRSSDAASGGEVTLLQDFLQSNGYLNSEPTGFFGLMTMKAVAAFQSKNGITPAVGYVGPTTRAKIQSISCASAQNPVNNAAAAIRSLFQKFSR